MRILIRREGTQFIETVLSAGRGAHTAAIPSPASWTDIEQRLLVLDAHPHDIAAAKADFDAGKDATSVDVLRWFYEIRGTGNRQVEESEPIYNTEAEALAAGGERAGQLVNSVGAPSGSEIFSLMAGRK